jgi:hypothetical protein
MIQVAEFHDPTYGRMFMIQFCLPFQIVRVSDSTHASSVLDACGEGSLLCFSAKGCKVLETFNCEALLITGTGWPGQL